MSLNTHTFKSNSSYTQELEKKKIQGPKHDMFLGDGEV